MLDIRVKETCAIMSTQIYIWNRPHLFTSRFNNIKYTNMHLWGDKALWRELKLYGGVIFITIVSLFHLFRNIQHPAKRSDFFKNFFEKWQCIRSCYLQISSNLLKKSLRKTSLFALFDLLPTGLLNYVYMTFCYNIVWMG